MKELFIKSVSIMLAVLPLLSVLLVFLKKWKPGLDPYFEKSSVVLQEVDDIIDAVLLEFPNNDMLSSIDQVLDKILGELGQAGYEVDDKDGKKVENRLKARIKREGIKTEFDLKANKWRIKYDKNF